jgi:glutathionylspermidine synthase
MDRLALDPRPDWPKRVEEFGLFFHTAGGVPYWDESACYRFTPAEVALLETATAELHAMCLELVQEVIDKRLFGLFLIPPEFEEFVVRSWRDREPSVYGRFDLAFDGTGPPKLLEYNADTPTALVEAAVAQWFWLKDVDPAGDQFNSIHEHLIDAWRAVRERDPRPVHFAAQGGVLEDYVTVEYLRDTAIQAGFETTYLDVEQIGWDATWERYVGLSGEPIERAFKLYPWEWMVREEFGLFLPAAATRWVEPPWKMVLSCKSILPLLYERHPDCPYLLPASFEPMDDDHVTKPVHAREGSNITVVVGGEVRLETGGNYGEGPFVHQRLAPLRPFGGRYPIVGSWVVNGRPCGVGIREDDALVTQNTSRFIPHRIEE